MPHHVSELLRDALAAAADIHLDATDRGGRVRFRVDGVLADVRETDAATHAALVAVQVMAALDIAERRLPQDRRLQVTIAGHPLTCASRPCRRSMASGRCCACST